MGPEEQASAKQWIEGSLRIVRVYLGRLIGEKERFELESFEKELESLNAIENLTDDQIHRVLILSQKIYSRSFLR